MSSMRYLMEVDMDNYNYLDWYGEQFQQEDDSLKEFIKKLILHKEEENDEHGK